jgi:GT2 family glycosyltransferase
VPKTISVLIPTYGREKEVIDTVEALQKQTRVPDEIVVVDQNGDLFPKLDHFLDTAPRVRHIKAPNPGVSINYNRCLENAKSDIVLFLDDDVIPDPQLIEAHLNHYQDDHSKIGGIAGRVEQPSGDWNPDQIPKNLVGRFHRWSGKVTGHFNFNRRCEVQTAPGGNMSFRRDVLLKTGGFDLGFEGNGYFFETDGSLRVHQAGYQIIFDPQANLKHLMAPAGGARVTDKAVHTYYFVKNGIRMCRRHSPLLALPYCYLRLVFYFIAKALYNRNPRILTQGCLAFWRGIRQPMQVIGISKGLESSS